MLSSKHYLCLLVLLLAAGRSVFAQLAVTPAQVNYRLYHPLNYPGGRFLAPDKRIISLMVPEGVLQPWTVRVSGALTSACLFFSPCFRVTEEYSSVPVTGSSGSRRLALNWYGQQPFNLPPGTYQAVITFEPVGGGASATVNVQLEVLPATIAGSPEPLATAPGVVNGCSVAEPSLFYSLPVRCEVPDEAPVVDPELTALAVGQVALNRQRSCKC